ncbi:MAG: hypothetical protein Q4C52_11770 [Eubacteriales bacterium]|nr:hypothetical protein [Eubacteriales bacterium]
MKKLYLLVLIVILSCLGCSAKEPKEEDMSVSTSAEKVIEAMMSCPNAELYNSKAVEMIGDGITEADNEAAKEEQARLKNNWKVLVGDYFEEGTFEDFLGITATTFLTEADMTGEIISVESIELVEKHEYTELVKVNLKRDDKEEQVTILFTYDSEGKIKKVEMQ